jgi:protoheme IX farnesyltransferase
LLLAVASGTALGIASACVFNNYIDRDIDKKMQRTRKRALVSGAISGTSALIYGVALGTLGFTILVLFTNLLVVTTGLIGVVFYLIFYGLAKRTTSLSTVVGSIPGATPPVAGYLAVTNHLDSGALLLFLIMAIWQMPHFYSIAVFRLKDYAAAGLPVLPVKKGVRAAKLYIILYIAAYLVTIPWLTILGYTGYSYLVVMSILGSVWLVKALGGFRTNDNVRWARRLFGFSLIVLLAFSVMISAQMVLP